MTPSLATRRVSLRTTAAVPSAPNPQKPGAILFWHLTSRKKTPAPAAQRPVGNRCRHTDDLGLRPACQFAKTAMERLGHPASHNHQRAVRKRRGFVRESPFGRGALRDRTAGQGTFLSTKIVQRAPQQADDEKQEETCFRQTEPMTARPLTARVAWTGNQNVTTRH